MSETQQVRHNGSTVTFHPNASSHLKGHIYVTRASGSGGQRVYGRIDTDDNGTVHFTSNEQLTRDAHVASDAELQAQPV